MKFSVTQRDIKLGKRRDCVACPVFRAIKRKAPHILAVGETFIDWRIDDRRVYIDTPDNVATFVCRFDEGLPVEPFTFELGVLLEAK